MLRDDGIDVDAFIGSGQPIRAVNIGVSTSKRIARIEFDRLPTRFYMLLIPQHETEQMLERRLLRMGLRIEHDKELVGFEQGDDSVMGEVRDGNGKCELSMAAWLLGCDGAHSTTRHLLGASFEGSSYQSTFMIADVVLERSEMHVFTTGYGPIAFFRCGAACGESLRMIHLPTGATNPHSSNARRLSTSGRGRA